MTSVDDVQKKQEVVLQTVDGRVIIMDSITFADERNNSGDVLVGASFCGMLAIRWPLRVNPKGVICHAAGPGKDMAGINGLFALEALQIPGAAAATHSCRIADGRDLYDNGTVAHYNDSAAELGVVEGMAVKEAADRMLKHRRQLAETYHPIELAYQGPTGRVMAMGSVTFITEANAGDVICAGSHFGRTSAAYSSRFALSGVICNDAGRCKDDSGIAGLSVLDDKAIPGAAVSTESAAIGDGMSTFRDGIISAVNKAAASLGIVEGMTARDGALLMLQGKGDAAASG